ncbi:MAG: NAD(P)H-dependent oxidoreductase subunit E, partial [Thermoprotei archaeon]
MCAVNEQKTRLQTQTSVMLDFRAYVGVVDKVIQKYGIDRSKLINMLQDIQKEFHYLPKETLKALSSRLGISLSEVLNVATFYHQFRLEPLGMYVIQVCFGTACYLKGSPEIYESIRRV